MDYREKIKYLLDHPEFTDLSQEKDFLLALTAVNQMGSKYIFTLLDQVGTPGRVFQWASHNFDLPSLGRNQLVSPKRLDSWRKSIQQTDPLGEAEAIKNFAARHKARLITILDQEYPARLLDIPAPPLYFFLRGDCSVLMSRSVAIIGTRKIDNYGEKITSGLAGFLAGKGICVVSGGALGADTAAHKAVCQVGGSTIVVLGSSFDDIYPVQNWDLFQQVERSGAVISQFMPTQGNPKHQFVQRNWLVAALAESVVVTQAPRKSGALITAGYALKMGRKCYTLPGPIDNPSCGGSNNLLKSGAKPILDTGDALEMISSPLEPTITGDKNLNGQKVRQGSLFLLKPKPLGSNPGQKDIQNSVRLPDKNAQKLLDSLKGGELTFDQILLKMEGDLAQLYTLLMEMEIEGRIVKKPGNIYRLREP